MLDHKDVMQRIVQGVHAIEPVTVRETYWGYVVRSARPEGSSAAIRDKVLKFARLSVWIAVVGVWLTPSVFWPDPAFVAKALLSAVLICGVYAAGLFSRSHGGYEFQVDRNRREVRSAVLNEKGEIWVRAKARFDDIADALIQRSNENDKMHGLSVRLKSSSDVLPVAIGDQTTLMAVQDRLMRDLRPMEDIVAGLQFNQNRRGAATRLVFPKIGPDEVSA